MTSSLHYANLDIDDDAIGRRQSEVVKSLREFRDYLENAKRRLQDRRFVFKFTVDKKVIRPIMPEEMERDEIDISRFSFDKEGKEKLRIKNIDSKNKDLEVDGPLPSLDRLYYHRKGEVSPRTLRFELEVHLGNIEPQVGTEEEEKEAEEFIFDHSEAVYEVGSRYRRFARIVRSEERKGRIIINEDPTSDTLEVGVDTQTLERQIRAIEVLATRPLPHHKPLLRMLVKTSADSWPIVNVPNDIETLVLDERFDGHEEQSEFVGKAMATPDLAILEGPPGSGKTATLIELLAQCVKQGLKVMMVASTHVAVDNILERISEGEDGHRLMDKFGIVPLRIGRENVVSERIGQFCLNRACNEERRRLRSALGKLKMRTEYQEMLFQTLCSEESGRLVMEDMVLEMSNFVCGTTIGILQAPMIKQNRDPIAHFDVLILDEASKTTFQEFLVPALYAKKWILSGDPLQLAPYVEENHIIESLAAFAEVNDFSTMERSVCMDVLQSFMRSIHPSEEDYCRVIVLEDGDDRQELYRAQIEAVTRIIEARGEDQTNCRFGLGAIMVVGELNDRTVREVMVASLIITNRSSLAKIESYFGPRTVVINSPGFNDTLLRRARAGRCDADPYKKVKSELTWEGEVAWRIGRMYEIKDRLERYAELQFEIEMLLPHLNGDDGNENGFGRDQRIMEAIDSVRRIALPSVLDLLINGFETNRNTGDKIALFNGLPKGVMGERKVVLTRQHRMHPEISEFPHVFIYNKEALIDGSEVERKRSWSCDNYPRRSMLVDTRPRNDDVKGKGIFNMAEVRRMLDELKTILDWTSQNRRPKGERWSIALLSFYKAQERELASMVRERYMVKGFRFFELPKYNAELEVCNVDRFQGHEADIVLLSFVRSRAHGGGVGFLDNKNRFNVAITRARYQLLIFADKEHFMRKGTPLLRDYMKYLQDNINYRG
jgi:hypothetical protein